MDNLIASFRGRKVNLNRKVRVYRNLHQRGVVWSIRQDGLVVGHARSLLISPAKFIVSEAVRQRAIREKKKRVHAFVEGMIVGISDEKPLPVKVTYNPFKYSTFVTVEGLQKVSSAALACLNKEGLSVLHFKGTEE